MPSSSSSSPRPDPPSPPPPPPPPPCGNLAHLADMPNGTTCRAPWSAVRGVLHPSQPAVGYAAVKRKLDKDYQTETQAQQRMNENGSQLPFVLGPPSQGVPYLVDSHHTVSALEASGFCNVHVTLQKIGDWSHLSPDAFFQAMKRANFIMGVGRPPLSSGPTNDDDDDNNNNNNNSLPVPINVAHAIPRTIPELQDDPWRSLAALVRKVKNKEQCPPGKDKCMRGYIRDCRDDGSMTAFFEFRWAYFMNYAYHVGCNDPHTTTLWDNASDCLKFQAAFTKLMETNQNNNATTIQSQNGKAWQEAARLLVPLCRSKAAQTFILPHELGNPMGGEPLPGCVRGKTQILRDDPKCQAPQCPTMPQ